MIPLDVSQSQTSVPSRSMANPSKPPPGNTTTATPVFFAVGEYTVIVGRVTFFTQTYCFPATWSSLPVVFASSGPGTGCASGTAPGHIGTCVYPGAGCHAAVCARRTANPETT